MAKYLGLSLAVPILLFGFGLPSYIIRIVGVLLLCIIWKDKP